MALPGLGKPSFGGGAPVLDENGMPIANLRRVLRGGYGTARSPVSDYIPPPHQYHDDEDGQHRRRDYGRDEPPQRYHDNHHRRQGGSMAEGSHHRAYRSGLSDLRGTSDMERETRARKELAQKRMLEEQIEEQRLRKDEQRAEKEREKQRELDELLREDPQFAQHYAAYHQTPPHGRESPSRRQQHDFNDHRQHHSPARGTRSQRTEPPRRAMESDYCDARNHHQPDHDHDDHHRGHQQNQNHHQHQRRRPSYDRVDDLSTSPYQRDPAATPDQVKVRAPMRYRHGPEEDQEEGQAPPQTGGIMSLLQKNKSSSSVGGDAPVMRRQQYHDSPPRRRQVDEDDYQDMDVRDLAKLCKTLVKEQRVLKRQVREQQEVIHRLESREPPKASSRTTRQPAAARAMRSQSASAEQARSSSRPEPEGGKKDKATRKKGPTKVAFGSSAKKTEPRKRPEPNKRRSSKAPPTQSNSPDSRDSRHQARRHTDTERGLAGRERGPPVNRRQRSEDMELRGESVMYPHGPNSPEDIIGLDQLDRLISRVHVH